RHRLPARGVARIAPRARRADALVRRRGARRRCPARRPRRRRRQRAEPDLAGAAVPPHHPLRRRSVRLRRRSRAQALAVGARGRAAGLSFRRMERPFQRWAPAVAVIAAAIWIGWQQRGGYWIDSHEHGFYPVRLVEWLESWRAGARYPRWCPGLYGGY